jgi:phage terminase large subunit GpA-like protein
MAKQRKPVPLSGWIEQTVRLPVGLSAEPGPIKLAPYMVEIADAIADPQVETVVCQKSARIGWTTLMSSVVAHYLVRDPCRVLTVWPTESDARGWTVADLEPIFLESPKLRDKLPMPHPGRSDRTTLLHRIGSNGASLTVIGAGAPRNLRRHNAKVLIVDEADACAVLSEGDPIGLAITRTLSFSDRKILIGSTPLDEQTSHICRLYAQSDRRVWQVCCPHCHAYSEIAWRDIEWPVDRPDLAAWRCPACHELVAETHKVEMVRNGRWHAQNPEVGPAHRGYKINALVSSLANASWSKLAVEYGRAKDDDATLKVFQNTILAEPWRETADEVEDLALAGRVEPFSLDRIPDPVAFITCGVDVQQDRFEITVAGHARDGTMFILAHVALWGSPLENASWVELDQFLLQRWRHPRGGQLKVDCAAIDAGDGGVYDIVLAFSQSRLGRKVLAIKGIAGFARPAIAPSKTRKGKLFIAGIDSLKSQLLTRLARGRSVRFSNTLTADYFSQLAAEKRVVRLARGKPTVRFERKIGVRNEALDACIYCMVARAALNLTDAAFDQREGVLQLPEASPAPRPAVVKSQFMERGRW